MAPHWEPDLNDRKPLNPRIIKRIQKDIENIVKNPPHGVMALPDEDNMKLIHVLLIGAQGTPYQGGIFRLIVAFDHEYPLKPPKIKFLTTFNGTVQFNPHLYADGMICLSILGTHSGPGWSPVFSLSAVMVSVQTLMDENPLYSGNDYTRTIAGGRSDDYNQFIQHETIRVAVIDVLEKRNTYPKEFIEKIETTFLENYDYYLDACTKHIKSNGQKKINSFNSNTSGVWSYKSMIEKLKMLKLSIDRK